MRVHRRWSRRRALFALLIAGQLLTGVGAKVGSPLWLVAGPWLGSVAVAAALLVPAAPAITWRTWLRAHRWELSAVVSVTLLGAALRLTNLEHIPNGIDVDEAWFALIAQRVLHGNGPKPFGVAFLGDPALNMHLMAVFIRLLGPSMTALRMLPALAGTATVAVVCGFVWDLWGGRPALLAGLLLATTTAHIHFSRIGLNVIEVPLFACLSLWALSRGIRDGRDLWYLLAGLAGGFGFYFHFGARLTGVILVLALLTQQLAQRLPWRRWLRAVALTGAGALLALNPMIAYLSGRPSDFTEHMVERGIWNSWQPLAERFGTVPSDHVGIIWQQLRRSIEAFISRPDPYWGATFFTFTDKPLLNPVVAPLALAGLVLLCLRWSELRARLVVIWFVVPIIFASTLTDVAGQGHRMVNPLVPAVIAAAVLLDVILGLATARLPALGALAATLLIVTVPAVAAARETLYYFDPNVSARYRAMHAAQARCLQALPAGTLALIDGAPDMYADDSPSQYLSPQTERYDLPYPAANLPWNTGGRPLAILVFPWRDDDLPLIRERYPHAATVEIDRPAGVRMLTVFGIPAAGSSDLDWLARCQASASLP